MGNATSLSMIRHCIGAEVAPSVIKSLAGATQQMIEGVVAKIKGLGIVPGLSPVEIARVLGEARGCHAEQLVAIMGPKTSRRVDAYEMLAVMIMFAKTQARLKVRNMFDMFDLDLDGKLSPAETILMLRSLLVAVAKSTGGVLPATAGIEDIWHHIVRSGFTENGEYMLFAQWVMFCSKSREVHVLGKALDFNRGKCRKALLSGLRATLPKIVFGDEDSESAEAGTRLQGRTPQFRHKKKQTVVAKQDRNRFSRATALKIKEAFDSIDKEDSGYVNERQWRSLTKDTPLAASCDTSLFVRRERVGKISIVEALSEVYPFASDADLARMLQWISKGPSQQGAGRLVGRKLAAERVEMILLFQTMAGGNAEMTLGEVATALADTAGLRKEDVMPMFLHPATTRTEEDYITASEFVDIMMSFIDGDTNIQSLLRSAEKEWGLSSLPFEQKRRANSIKKLTVAAKTQKRATRAVPTCLGTAQS